MVGNDLCVGYLIEQKCYRNGKYKKTNYLGKPQSSKLYSKEYKCFLFPQRCLAKQRIKYLETKNLFSAFDYVYNIITVYAIKKWWG